MYIPIIVNRLRNFKYIIYCLLFLNEKANMAKEKYVAAIAVVVAVVSAYMFLGTTSSFMRKVQYLSDRYPTFECLVAWRDWPAHARALSGGRHEYRLNQARSWTSFKSTLMQTERDRTFLGSVFYERGSRVIWFDTLEWQGMGRPLVHITWYYRASTPW